jgi:putative hydrolase of the HAD superfamily
MIKAVLFDLDQTLLDIDGDAFLEAYVEALAAFMAPLVNPADFRQALWSASVAALTEDHPGRTNHSVVWHALSTQLGIATDRLETHATAFNATDLRVICPGGSPKPGAHDAVRVAQKHGLAIAVATTPIYDVSVIRERLRRAELATVGWDVIANDQFYTTKPHPSYFLELAQRLGVAPTECLMVGDDYFADLPARKVGMATFYVGPPLRGLNLGPTGTLLDLPRHLRDLA